jgi:beta-glucosidase
MHQSHHCQPFPSFPRAAGNPRPFKKPALMLAALLLLAAPAPIWLDPTQPVSARVSALLANLTLKEKIGQITQVPGQDGSAASEARRVQAGSVLSVFGEDAAPVYAAAAETRLGIPILLGLDAIHGNAFWPGATVYPSQLGQAAAWDAALVEAIGAATAAEMAHTGVHWAFSPVLCIARDPRWGRVGESYGEDPLLIGRLAAALVRGLQSRSISACPKHFAGYSETHGGLDASEADLSVRKLRAFFLPPFQRAVEAGALTFMSSYQATEGVPSTVNRFLLQQTLRDEWGFQGLVVTDWNTVGDMVEMHSVFADYEHASAASIEAGVDLVMACPQFYDAALSAVANGLLSLAAVDRAVSRVLRVKFELGLFENPRAPDVAKVVVGTPEHRALALRAAQESLILLKNNATLPISTRNAPRTIAVIGPNADHVQAHLGDWALGAGQAFPLKQPSARHPRANTTTVLDGIRAAFPSSTILYNAGATVESDDKANLTAAVAAAKAADLIILVVGDRYPYIGETKSTAKLELPGNQVELLNAIVALKKPFVLDLLASKPLIIPQNIISAASAIIAQFTPGNLGGQAFADALTGKLNPSGKLTVSVPATIGQIPVYYNAIRGHHGESYADSSYRPRWAFGYGLSYSTFVYSDASLSQTVFKKEDDIVLSLTVTNKGPYDGVDVVQVYVSDLVTSATWAVQELKAFERVALANGESRKLRIVLKAADCSIVNASAVRVVEPGDFELRIGQASDNILFRLSFSIT